MKTNISCIPLERTVHYNKKKTSSVLKITFSFQIHIANGNNFNKIYQWKNPIYLRKSG